MFIKSNIFKKIRFNSDFDQKHSKNHPIRSIQMAKNNFLLVLEHFLSQNTHERIYFSIKTWKFLLYDTNYCSKI